MYATATLRRCWGRVKDILVLCINAKSFSSPTPLNPVQTSSESSQENYLRSMKTNVARQNEHLKVIRVHSQMFLPHAYSSMNRVR